MKRWPFALVFVVACFPQSNDRPDTKCADACKVQLKSQCSEHECERGCAFVIDRLVEREQGTVIDCMKTEKACDDSAWAMCAVKVGPHVDGGPAVPQPGADEPPKPTSSPTDL